MIYIYSLSDLYNQLDFEPAFVLIIVRHPLQWYKSYKQWANKCEWPKVNYNYMFEWFLFHEKWLQLKEQAPTKIYFIKYENILREDHADLHLVEKEHNIKSPRKYISKFDKVPVSKHFDISQKSKNLIELSIDDVAESDIEKQQLQSIYNQYLVNKFY